MPFDQLHLPLLGQFVGPLLFKPADAPTYGPGFKAVVITACVTAGLALIYRYLCIWENKHRDKAGVLEAFEHAYEDDVTDRKVRFTFRCFRRELGLHLLTYTFLERPIPVCVLRNFVDG